MKQRLNLEDIKNAELNMLIWFDSICKQNKLSYSLCGGSLLGAVRHKGFIPWDDDIDVCMSRLEYDILIDLIKNKNIDIPQYMEFRAPELENTEYPFLKLYDNSTECEIAYKNEDVKALWIDILPVDGLPEDDREVTRIYKKSARYRNMILWRIAIPGEGKTFLKKITKPIMIFATRLFPYMFFTKRMCDLAKHYSYHTSRYVGIIVWGLYGIGERVPKDEFEKKVNVLFEGREFPAMSCYKKYLSGIYGDYMKLPPKEKRKTHDMVAYRKE